MKKIALIFFLSTMSLMSQKERSLSLGRTSLEELKLTGYEKDSTASALVLYEQANRYPDKNEDEIPRTDFYFRIKIFDKSAFDLADVQIYLRKNERLLDVKAISYNLTDEGTMDKKFLNEDDIFSIDETNNWTSKKFTIPNIKEGSVIEYRYSILSPYLVIDDWYFQSDIPKLKSEFKASILGNYKYNIKVTGFQKLNTNDAQIDKKCVYLDGIGFGSCVVYTYAMENIPAFKEEDFMLSKKNYISRLSFDLKSRTSYQGEIKNYTTTWKKADKNLKKYFFNNQISKKNFFKKQIPKTIFLIKNQLDKAKKIYSFIQNHYTWNGNYWRNSDAKLKKAFDEKSGDVGEINLSLFNSLQAAGIDTKLVVLSTRKNGLTTKIYPVIFDYNYVVVQALINNKTYYLDATNKFLPFGQVPFKAINGEARVLDFNNESYWVRLKPQFPSSVNLTVRLKLNDDENLEGGVMIRRTGYYAINQRRKLSLLTEDKYIEDFESDYPYTEVESIEFRNKTELEKPLSEIYKIKIIDENGSSDKIRINPILFYRLQKNPFKLKERNFPVDFGYTRKQNYSIVLSIPDEYEIYQVPKDIAISLPNDGGTFIYKTIKKGNNISLYARLNISRRIFSNEEYFALKEFYKQIIIAENSLITLKRKL
ncbi:hypothetical protein [uncultured Polaribacter sp.]|uniref:hypothetical protein n=1 Tax=uncultured Polaribacter sp. TaxID=174711 RepID=UPI00259BCD4F|nr:hypothetical protein [uncultured Polaribacter sp.]